MRAVIQRATSGEVRVDGTVVGRLALDPHEAEEKRQGLVVLLGVQRGDGPEQVATVARKIAELRILDDECSALDAGAPILVISQFTLYGDTRKGRRPSWAHAAPGEEAEPLVDAVVADLRGRGLHVETGQFGSTTGPSRSSSRLSRGGCSPRLCLRESRAVTLRTSTAGQNRTRTCYR